MLGSWQTWELPNLNDQTGRITSPISNRYNCIAWAAGDATRWWWPDPVRIALKLYFWPPGVPVELTFDAFLQAFGTLGFEECSDGNPETGFEKIAIYGRQKNQSGLVEPTHAALQLKNGGWTSKLGQAEDVQHNELDGVSGPTYGAPVRFMRRPIS